MIKENTLRSITHLDKLIRRTQEKQKAYIHMQTSELNKDVEAESKYYQTKYHQQRSNEGAGLNTKEEYFKEQILNENSLQQHLESPMPQKYRQFSLGPPTESKVSAAKIFLEKQ